MDAAPAAVIRSLHSVPAERMVQHLTKEAERIEAAQRTLKFISGQTGSVVLNFSRHTFRNDEGQYRADEVEMFADGLSRHGHRMTDAFMEARRAVEDYDDPRSPKCSYFTTIVLHSDGHWSEQYLFPL